MLIICALPFLHPLVFNSARSKSQHPAAHRVGKAVKDELLFIIRRFRPLPSERILHEHIDTVLKLLAQVGDGAKRVVLVGHSRREPPGERFYAGPVFFSNTESVFQPKPGKPDIVKTLRGAFYCQNQVHKIIGWLGLGGLRTLDYLVDAFKQLVKLSDCAGTLFRFR